MVTTKTRSLFAAMLLNWYAGVASGRARGIFFYSNFLICAAMVALLSGSRRLPLIPGRFDRWMGDLSYPIYLLHYQVALAAAALLRPAGFAFSGPDFRLMLVLIPFILLAAWLFTVLIEHPVERLRLRVKARNAPGGRGVAR